MSYGGSAFGESDYGPGALVAPPFVTPDPDVPVGLLELALTTDPLDPSPAWYDISGRLRAYKTVLGRNRDLDQNETGTANFTVDNFDRALDPDNTASTFYPNVRPLRRVRYRELWADVVYAIFDGFIETIDFDFGYPRANDALIKASDAFMLFADIPMPSSVWATEIRKENLAAWWRLGEASGDIATDSVGQYHGTYTDVAANGRGASPVVGYEADGATQFDGDGFVALPGVPITSNTFTFGCWVQPDTQDDTALLDVPAIFVTKPDHHGLRVGFTIDTVDQRLRGLLQWTESSGLVDTERVGPAFTPGQKYFLVGVMHRGGVDYQQLDLYVNGVLFFVDAELTDAPDVAPGTVYGQVGASFKGTVDEVFYIDGAISAARVAELYAAGTNPWDGDTTGQRINRLLDLVGVPSSWRNVDTGVGILGPTALGGKLLDHLRDTAKAEQGDMYMTPDNKLRFESRHAHLIPPFTSLATYSTTGTGFAVSPAIKEDRGYDLIRRLVRGSRVDGPEFEARDPALTANSVVREDSDLTNLPFRNDNDVQDLIHWRLRHYKDETIRFQNLELTGVGEESTYYPEMLGRAMGDRVTVVHKQPGPDGSPVTSGQHITRIEREASDGVTRKVTFATRPAESTTYWLLGDPTYSVLGSTTRLAS